MIYVGTEGHANPYGHCLCLLEHLVMPADVAHVALNVVFVMTWAMIGEIVVRGRRGLAPQSHASEEEDAG